MTGRFEWHITVDRAHRAAAQITAEILGFTFSEITGCPIISQGTYCYVTGFQTHAPTALEDMGGAIKQLQEQGAKVLRAKIEDIVYDTKTGVDRIGA